ncbi:CBS domain-containing protein [Roseisolibacter sp. H3M3-2]|uniref:CBS domain-containing protein n=1 Tax=Roseisolibacter sp. H3M3-2 TaxID=3031323 RepID=UPI0023DAA0EB|nr:CBS domain-containing protein [Roseisolibacter sp. H3M3-2]MDF1505380.1 CBS domain-containing protein [Roseisolibacter sp. H3M3-2]
MASVRELLVRKHGDLVTVTGGTTVLDASTLMVGRGIGGVLVVEDGVLVGIFTERDVLRRVVAVQRDPATTAVREVMTSPVLTVAPETPLEDCRVLMSERRIRHLPVTADGALVGVVSSGDVLAYEVSERQATIQQLESYVYYVRS